MASADIDWERYAKQVLFAPIGEAGQVRLQRCRVVLIGCGALGSASAEFLVRAGIGDLKICDRDYIELSNLQRQSLFDERDIEENLPKAEAAARRLRCINSKVTVEPIVADVNFTNIEALIRDADLVVDGTDNFEVRFLINDACVKNKIPWIYAACVGSYGMTLTIRPYQTPCFRCILNYLPPAGSTPTCDTAGIVNAAAGVVAALQGTEVLKLLAGKEAELRKELLVLDVWANTFQKFEVQRLENCLTCGQKRFEFMDAKKEEMLTHLCGRNAVQVFYPTSRRIDLPLLAQKLSTQGRVTYNAYLLKFRVGAYEMTVFPDGRAIIAGTSNPSGARSLYKHYVGTAAAEV